MAPGGNFLFLFFSFEENIELGRLVDANESLRLWKDHVMSWMRIAAGEEMEGSDDMEGFWELKEWKEGETTLHRPALQSSPLSSTSLAHRHSITNSERRN